MASAGREPKERYGSLRLYSGVAFAFGWIIIGLGVVAAVAGVVLAVIDDDRLGLGAPVLLLTSVGILMFFGLVGLRLLAYSDLILVFIDVEENTRLAASRLLDAIDPDDDV